ncbi:MAG: hypothetical protein KGH63_00385 [Candidatus Micrarchaeota archaeon]|nr:hypothetical protein [Candidatus Micrarchaeota archaeon]
MRPVLLLGILLALVLPLHAQSDSLPTLPSDSGFWAPDALPPPDSAPTALAPLPDYCNPFWKNGWYTPYAITTLSGAVIYDPTVHQTVLSANLSDWDDGSLSSASAYLPPSSSSSGGHAQITNEGLTHVKNAQKAAALAQGLSFNESREYEQYSSDWGSHFANDSIAQAWASVNTAIPLDFSLRVYDTLTPRGIAGIPLRIRPGVTMNDITHLVPPSIVYSRLWQETMQASTDALHEGADGVNAAFAQDQAQANTLYDMGVDDPSYQGGARGAWQDWQAFVAQSARWSDPGQPLTDGTAPEQRYGRAYRSLSRLQDICAHPPALPDLSDGANLSATFNDLAGGGPDTLWNIAWQHYGALRAAYAQMNLELDDHSKRADGARQNSTAALAALQAQGPGNFSASLPASADAGAGLVQPSAISGTIPEQAAAASQLMAQADSERDQARRWSDPANRNDYALASASSATPFAGWASQALAHYEKAILYYAQAQMVSENAKAQMDGLTGQARDTALASAQSLQAQLDAGLSAATAGPSAAAQTQARAALAAATKKISQADAAPSLGKRYALYLDAIALLSDAQAALSSPAQSTDAYALNQTLAQFKALLAAAPALGVDVGDAQSGYANFYSALSSGWVPPGSAELAANALESLRAQLRSALTDEESQYQSLESAIGASAAFDPSGPSAFSSAFAPYRSAGGWSDLALEKPQALRALLSKWQSYSDALSSKALSSTLCQNARWQPATILPLAGARLDAGGQWSSSNTLGMDYSRPLSIDCPLAHSFLPTDQAGASDNVLSAATSGGNLHLSLSGLAAGQSVWVNYSSDQRPFQLTQTGCLLGIDEQGQMDWRANYSLKSDYPTPTLAIDIPWPSDSAGPATLSWAGMPFAGQWGESADAASPSPASAGLANASAFPAQVQFLIPNVPSGSQSFSVEITPEMPAGLMLSSAQASPTSAGSLAVSYQMQLSGLPSCSEALVRRTDGASEPLSKILVQSSDAQVKALSSATPDGTWYFTMRALPPDGRVNAYVSYEAANSSEWFGTTLSSLQSQAQALNDQTALDQLSSAASLYQSGQTSQAYALTRAAELRLQGESGDGGQSLQDWTDESQAAGEKLSQLAALSKTLSTSSALPPWASELPAWSSELSAALDSANASAQAGNFDAARSTYRKAEAAFSQKALTAAQSDYRQMSDQLAADSSLPFLTPGNGSDLSSPVLSNASFSLSAARDGLQNADAPSALAALAAAHQFLDAYGQSALANARQSAQAQRQAALVLQATASNLSDQLQNYINSLASLSSAGTSAFKPPLTAAEARTLQSQSVKAAPDPAGFADPSGWNDLSRASTLISKQQKAIDQSNQTLSLAGAKVAAASQSIQSAAEQLARMASASVAQAHQSAAAAGTPSDSAAAMLSSLDADLSRLNDLMGAQEWPDAIVLGQSIVSRAKPLIGTAAPASSPPWLLIGLTLLLIAGVAYVVMFRRPGEQKPPAAPGAKKLERA